LVIFSSDLKKIVLQNFAHSEGREKMAKQQSKLNLSVLQEAKVPSYEKEVNIFEEVELVVQSPDGKELARWKYPIGEAIATIKKRICDENNLTFNNVKLYINEKDYLLDPLSLNDIPAIVQNKTQPIVIKMEITT
jgi:hypothetical protein